ncbi:hypothetical protein, partial [Pseudomonas syringae]|uniref:hypothetical protein n=1 Tax=Pseudomonas syringae TaxID=317 RepID=UPI0034D3D3DA
VVHHMCMHRFKSGSTRQHLKHISYLFMTWFFNLSCTQLTHLKVPLHLHPAAQCPGPDQTWSSGIQDTAFTKDKSQM